MFFPQCSNLKSFTALSLESRCWPCQLCAKNAFSWVAFLGIFKLMVVAAGDDPGKFHPCRHKAGSAETCQPPQGIRGFSALSLCHGTDWACSHQAKKISTFLPVGRQAGLLGKEHIWERDGFSWSGGICAALPLEQHTDRHGTMKIKNLVDVCAVSSSPSPSHVVCPVP